MSYQTVDLDNDDKYVLKKIVSKIKQCKYCEYIIVNPSVLKGYHITIICKKYKECDMCRIAFDDRLRYLRDVENRKDWERNVLFQSKKVFWNGKMVINL